MTTTRLARAGRSRFLIVIGIIIFMVGFIALFNNSQQQLEESNMLRLRCEQQHDALNARLQAIVDHKFRLEKNLENERKEHLETKQNLELHAKEEKSIHSKQVLDASVRLESSQQHYKILQSKHNDLVENCAKTKHAQSEQINGLEGKINSLQNQLQLIKTNQEKELEEWKMKYQNLINEKSRLEILLKVSEKSEKCSRFEKLLDEYKANCNYKSGLLSSDLAAESVQQQPPKYFTQNKSPEEQQHKSFVIEKSFKEQQLVSKDLYKIPISITNKTLLNNLVDGNLNINDKSSKINSFNNQKNKRNLGAIINSVENFQIAPKPIMTSDDQTPSNNNNNNEGFQQPPPLNPPNIKLSTSTKSSSSIQSPHDEINKRALPIANVASPSSQKYKITSSSTINTTRTTTAANNKRYLEHAAKPKQFPKGVAPIPENFDDLLKNDETNRSDIDNHGDDDGLQAKNNLIIGENKNSARNNRYANVVNEFSNNGVDNKKDKNDLNIGIGGGDNLEIKDHLQEVLDNLNNAGEDDQNNNNNNFFDTKLNHQNNLIKNNQNNDMDDNNVEVIGPPENDNIVLHHNENHKKDAGINNKLINEIVGDQGKEQAFPDGMHLEEPNEEDEDEDDYSNPAARKQEGAAIRN